MNAPLPPARRRAGLKDLIEEPYRVFFPLGALWSFFGVFFWVVKAFSEYLEEVSTKVHVWVQVYGFLWAFVIGFLGTAIPHFTKTRRYQWYESLAQASLSIAIVVSLLTQRFRLAHELFLVSAALLLLSLGTRFARGRRVLPVTFLFVPFGFVSAIVGSGLTILVLRGMRWRFEQVVALSNTLIFQGVMMFLLLGIGGFLVRSILGWLDAPPHAPGQSTPVSLASPLAKRLHILCALGLFVSFPLEAFVNAFAGTLLRAVLVTAECIFQIKIHRRPRSGKLTSRWIHVALWLLVLGLWGQALLPVTYRLAFLHLCFVGGFALSLFSVATRVVFSHGGYSHLLRRHYVPFSVAAVLMMIGLATRFTVDVIPLDVTRHLAYAGGAWSAGLLVWSAAVLPKIGFAGVEESKS